MQAPPFNTYLGMELIERGDGTAIVAIDLADHLLNRRGVAHGGVVTALMDSALGAAVVCSMPEEWWCATTSLSTQFVGGTGRGRLTATGRVVRRGSRVAFATGEARDESGKIVATASGTWHLWPHHPGRRPPVSASHVRLRRSGEQLRVGKILAVGRNYAEHNVEMGAPETGPPLLFFKPPTALAGDGDTLHLPTDAGQVHHEVELVAVIGRSGRAIPEAEALDHVLGFGVGLDLTLRDVQSEAKQRGEPWSLSKGFDGSAPVSEIAPRDEVGDGSGLEIRLDVNGETRQRGNTSQMQRSVARLIAFASRWITLERGDLLFTGTPAGVSPVQPGDRIEAHLEKVGSLSVTVASGDPDASS